MLSKVYREGCETTARSGSETAFDLSLPLLSSYPFMAYSRRQHMNENNRPSDSISIKFLSGPMAEQMFPIRNPAVTIGRASTNDIVVKDDLKVSRAHARLLRQNGTWSIEKLAPSHNTLTVNQQSVQHATLTNNTTVRLGADSSFLFLVNPEQVAAPVPSTTPRPAQGCSCSGCSSPHVGRSSL